MSSEELAQIWESIITEARSLAEGEPMLASFFHATLLKHENLGSALSYLLANKLANPIMPAIAVREIVEEAYRKDPSMIFSAARDVTAVRQRDPAVDKYSTPLLYLKGFHALQAYRIGNWLWKEGRRSLAVYLQNEISVSFGVDIHPAATIGCGIMLDHATGIVVGETAIIENDVSILQSVTLGGTGKTCGDRHPKIREGVMIGAGAKVLGNIDVGRGRKSVQVQSFCNRYRLIRRWPGYRQGSLAGPPVKNQPWIWISISMALSRGLNSGMVSESGACGAGFIYALTSAPA